MPATRRAKTKKQEETVVPDKLYFRIGEVAKLSKLPAYVLRFWETEFPQLRPTKSDTGQRMYRRREVEMVLRIKQLLYSDGFTIAGAREKLKADNKPAKTQSTLPFPQSSSSDRLREVRRGLKEILVLLSARR